MGCYATVLGMYGELPRDCGELSSGWLVTVLAIVGDHHGDGG